MKIWFSILIFLTGINFVVSKEKVLIFTYSYNRPDFIEIQCKTFKKFVKDPYEFIVFNDAPQLSMSAEIHKTCAKLNIRCINIPQKIHEKPYLYRFPGESFHAPAVRNCNVVQYSLNTLGFKHDGIIALFDSDLFLVKEFSFKDYLSEHVIGGLHQARSDENITIPYLWIGLAFFDFAKLPNKSSLNFNCGIIDGIPVDAGGYTYYYLKNNPTVPVRYFNYFHIDNNALYDDETLKQMGFDKNQITLMQSGFSKSEFMANGTFLHYRAGTNWDQRSTDFHQRKSILLKEYIELILSENSIDNNNKQTH